MQYVKQYVKGLLIFATIVIIAVLFAIFVLGFIAEKGFTESFSVSLLKSHYQPVTLENFESSVVDGNVVKEAGYVFSGEEVTAGGFPALSYLGFAEATIAYDDFGKVVYAHLVLVNRTVPKFTPTRTFLCGDKKITMFTEETEDYSVLAFGGSKLFDIIEESIIEDISNPSDILIHNLTDEVKHAVDQSIDLTEIITEVFLVWYYNPEKKEEYQVHLAQSLDEIKNLGCV
ncbi:MAG: hypothetical protein HYW25_03425 [Candidatus Aenigmarchaeota archaeon]|nr:hypothetical protein [Candidatus Aenigmarchaeota archaeon]